MKIRIAIVQFKIAHLDRAKNFQRIEGFIKKAAKKKAQVVVFPEDCVTGSIFGDVTKLDVSHANRETFCALARKYEIDIVTGSSMEKNPDGNFNTGYYINAKGEVLGTYRKNHLYPSEHSFLKSGIEAPVFKTAYGRAGIVICWDMLFPEIFERMKRQGVEIMYCPSYWYKEIAKSIAEHNSKSEEQLLDALCLTRSVECNAAMVYCNAAGIMKNPNGTVDTLIGHSQAIMPAIGAIKRKTNNNEAFILADLDLGLLKKSAEMNLRAASWRGKAG
ncbi:MAG: carbon-nitrogen hydrolase family protein [Patescibacteria group bacterium]|jgi:predicted amidohydrolase